MNGATVNVGLDPSKVVITKLKLDKDRKALLERKAVRRGDGTAALLLVCCQVTVAPGHGHRGMRPCNIMCTRSREGAPAASLLPVHCAGRVARTRARASSRRPRSRPCRTSTRFCGLHLVGYRPRVVGVSAETGICVWCHCALSLQCGALHHTKASLHKQLCVDALWLHCDACVSMSAQLGNS